MQSVTPTVVIVIVYILSIYFGRQAMRNQKAFQLKHFMYVYNLFQVVVCSYVTYEVKPIRRSTEFKVRFLQATDVWFREGYNFFCQPVDYSTRPNAMRVRGETALLFDRFGRLLGCVGVLVVLHHEDCRPDRYSKTKISHQESFYSSVRSLV